MKTGLIAIVALLCCSCVTSGDLRQVQDGMMAVKMGLQETQGEIGRLNAETDGKYEKLGGIVDAVAGSVKTAIDTLDDAASRAEENEAAIRELKPVTGNPLLDLGLTALLAVGAGTATTNKLRDKRRKERGEDVTLADVRSHFPPNRPPGGSIP